MLLRAHDELRSAIHCVVPLASCTHVGQALERTAACDTVAALVKDAALILLWRKAAGTLEVKLC